jgi:branched-chain amino acid transport system substrate-binding protein
MTSSSRHAGKHRSAATRWLVVGLCLSGTACVSTKERAAPPDAIPIATVLPFSGVRAASGVALETAMRLAVGEVNRAGGLAGRPLWLDADDSHSDDVRGTANALALINSGAFPYFIGTEEPKITYLVSGAIKTHQMVHVMPGLTSARFHDPSSAAAWFRISPSSMYLSCALAKHVLNANVRNTAVVLDPDDYNGAFSALFGQVFTARGGTVLPNLQLSPQNPSYADTFVTLAHLAPTAVVLITSPSVAAEFLQEWAVRGKPFQVFLGPTLNSPELLRNVPGGVLEGMTGISADLGEQGQLFEAYVQAQTSVPDIAGAHYYFDAVALLALAAAEGVAQTGAIPPAPAMMSHMVSITSPGGTPVGFDQLPEGMALLAGGAKVSYRGAAGSYVLNSTGDSTQNGGSIWQIQGSEFVTVDHEHCTQAEIQNGGHTPEDF